MKADITRVLLVIGALAGQAYSADIDWQPPITITGLEVIYVPEGVDAPVEAVNTTNSGIWYDLDLDQGVTLNFVSVGALESPDIPGLPILASTTGDAQFEPPNPDLDETFLTILGSHSWQGGGGEFNLGDVTPDGESRTLLVDDGAGTVIAAPGAFEPLVPGDEYVVQILGVFDGRGCCAERDTVFSDGRGVDEASDPLKRGTGQTIIGTFVADDTTQLIEVLGGEGGGGTDPGLSAYILWNVSGGGGTDPVGCDFNADSACNLDDIDLLMGVVASGSNDSAYDLNGDGSVNEGDRDKWLADAATENGLSAPYNLGDANLDLRVDANDLNEVGVAWQTDENKWSRGNFVGSGVGVEDLNAVGLNWQKRHPDGPLEAAASSAAVPEPTGAVLTLIGLLSLMFVRRK